MLLALAGWLLLTLGAGLALASVAPHALRPVLGTTALIFAATAYVVLLFTL